MLLDIFAIWFWSSILPEVNGVDALFEVIIEGFDAEVRVVFKCIV